MGGSADGKEDREASNPFEGGGWVYGDARIMPWVAAPKKRFGDHCIILMNHIVWHLWFSCSQLQPACSGSDWFLCLFFHLSFSTKVTSELFSNQAGSYILQIIQAV